MNSKLLATFSIPVSLIVSGYTINGNSPYCYRHYAKKGLEYKRAENKNDQIRGFMSIYKHADIYPSLSPKRGKLIVDNSNYGLNMVAKSIEISAKINNKSVTCTPNLRDGSAKCGDLNLYKKSSSSNLNPPFGWNSGVQFSRAEYAGVKYHVIHGVHPRRYPAGAPNGNTSPEKFNGPALIIDKGNPVYGKDCIDKFRANATSTEGTSAYNRSSGERYICVKKSTCSSTGAMTKVIESVYLVPQGKEAVMKTMSRRFGDNLRYNEYIKLNRSVLGFMKLKDVVPVTITYQITAKVEKPNIGF